jgi:hypothetical protein
VVQQKYLHCCSIEHYNDDKYIMVQYKAVLYCVTSVSHNEEELDLDVIHNFRNSLFCADFTPLSWKFPEHNKEFTSVTFSPFIVVMHKLLLIILFTV